MHRLLAAFVALSLGLLQAQSLAFHTHAHAEEHDEHDADRHDHQDPQMHHHAGASDAETHIGETDFSSDVVTVAVPAATALAQVVVHVASAAVHIDVPRDDAGRAPSVVTRSHDPPARSQARFRGPPSSLTL